MTVVPDSTTVTYQINQFFNTMVDHLGQVGESIEGNFATEAAQAVSAICVLFYLGWEMWPVIMGRRGPDIVKLLRPVLIAGVISAWPFFFLFFENIKTDLAMGARQLYATEQGDIMAAEKTMAMRIERMDSIRKKDLVAFLATSGNYDGMDRTSLESKDYDQLRNDYIDSEIKAGRQNRFAAGMIEFANCISTMVENVLKCIGQIALQAFFCGILVVGDFGTIVLGMFGPIMFGLSIAGAYRNHWAKWIEKYLCIALYPCLGYLAMAYVNWMILYYLEVECNITDTAISDWEKYVSVSYNHFGLIINYLVALFTGSYVMRAVPDLARAVFPGPSGNAAASAGAFVSGMTMATIGQAAKTAVAVTVGAVAAAGAATGAAVGGTMSESAKAAKAAKDSKDAFARKSKEKFDKLVNDKDSHGSSDLDGSSSYAGGNRHASVNDGSSDSHGGGASNGYDSYGAYKPYDTSGTGRYKKPESDGENFEYRRGGEKKTPKPSYAPQRNNKHVRRGEHYRPDRFRYRFIPAKLRAYWGSSIGFLANYILADDTNANPQAWSAALGGIKGGARKAYALPWIFADHFKKHSSNGTYQAINHWQKEHLSDMVFVRRPSIGGYIYQTYGEEAHTLAKLTGEKVRYVRVGTQKVATFTLNRHNLQPVIHRLNEMELSVNVINAKGRSIYYKGDISLGKQEAIDRIKGVLQEKGGDIRFNKTLNNFHTELSGDGYGSNRMVSVDGVMADIYGALHVAVTDRHGVRQRLYLDRLQENELLRLADAIEEMKDDQNALSVIPPDADSDDLDGDKVVDELNFAANEAHEYAQRAAQNAQGSSPTANSPADLQSDGQSDGDSQSPSHHAQSSSPTANDPADLQSAGQGDRDSQSPTPSANDPSADDADHNAHTQQPQDPSQPYSNGQSRQPGKSSSPTAKPKAKGAAPIDPIRQLKADTAWLNASPWSALKGGLTHGAMATVLIPLAGSVFLLSKFRTGRWLVSKGKAAKDSVSSVFGWNDRTRADIQKDLRAAVEYRWLFRTTVKDGIDFRQRPRRLPLSFSLKREKSQVIRRGRGITFNNVDYRKRTGAMKTARNGWKMTRWTTKGVARTTRYALGAATGTRPLVSISAIGKAGFKASYGGVRWMARTLTARNAVIAWKRENKHNYAIVRRLGARGYYYQTYGEDAIAIARILHKEASVRILHTGKGQDFASGRFLNRNAIPSLVLTTGDMARLHALIGKRGLTMDVITTRGRSLLRKRNVLTAAMGMQVPDGSPAPNSQAAPSPTTSGQPRPADPSSRTGQTPTPSDEDPNDGPVILDYSRDDALLPDKTIELKDKDGNVRYLVTGESLKTILEKMVRDGYSLKGLDLTAADLRDAVLKNADLSDAILTDANLRGARLQKAILTNADLTYANLRAASLYKADLTGATLVYADLRDAKVRKAIFKDTDRTSADLRGTALDNQNNA